MELSRGSFQRRLNCLARFFREKKMRKVIRCGMWYVDQRALSGTKSLSLLTAAMVNSSHCCSLFSANGTESKLWVRSKLFLVAVITLWIAPIGSKVVYSRGIFISGKEGFPTKVIFGLLIAVSSPPSCCINDMLVP